ncbi:uncharacterized protein Z518_08897 [Rhinocladiella mackenziei CBS 650.93]|uniref:Uncharacterized protein n=1 Tax=Rhinocladiella mackenziei CBS 650.93 TaxID=1442369 RepID=A0A0D2FGN9_9EURO|nr:uncharacterized protein Z518_08897 [Rhinocladiella mackenziei CBS 650.93]KIX01172.1 hypothetical protein Z518_08897 [Rhinocladiella mackenziei CBS 650.93]
MWESLKKSRLYINAGVVGRTVLGASEEDVKLTFEVNMLGVMWCLKTFLPTMITANHGHVLITSSATAFVTVAGAVDYSASKAAVTSIHEGIQTELKHKHGNPTVQSSAIFPATITTKMFEGIKGGGGFFLPVLSPDAVAERMLSILVKGESEIAMMPAMSNVNPWIRCLPVWMRVGAQDAGASSMDHLAVAKR